MPRINQVCVIGAGVMGSGIAAQVANSGTKVLLLDIASKDSDRSSIARSAIAKMQGAKPPPLSHPKRAELIDVGNLEDDLDKIKVCQLVIEVIVEKLEIKHDLYTKLLPYLQANTILASNTSTLPLHLLKKNLPEDVTSRFMITHFFNPPRYMPLLELITDKTTDKQAIDDVSWFASHRLGKSIVLCNDTPGFIANRIGCFLLELVLRKTIEHALEVDVVDLMMIDRMKLPSTGIFGLYDLIGLDVMALIAKSLTSFLPKNDRFVEIYTDVPLTQKMVAGGYTGRKGLGGFYRMRSEDNKKIKEVIDLKTGEYRALSALPTNNIYEKLFAEILNEFEVYVRSLVPEVTSNPADIDRAMRLGYSWKYGPFELFAATCHPCEGGDLAKNISSAGLKTNDESSANIALDPRLRGDDKVRGGDDKVRSGDEHQILSDALIFDINTKMNCLTEGAFLRLIDAVKDAEKAQKPLYIYSKIPHFSAGADLKFLLQKIQAKDFVAIEEYLELGQRAMMTVKYAKIPVISCARGVALGGGCELLLHSHIVVAHQQLSAGLVEVGLGLIPAFGGTKETVLRSGNNKELAKKLLGNIIRQNKVSSADYFAEDYMVDLAVNMNEDYLLEEAVALSGSSAGSRKTPEILNLVQDDRSLDVDGLGDYAQEITKILKCLFNAGYSENDLLKLEREIFIKLVQKPLVEERISKIIG